MESNIDLETVFSGYDVVDPEVLCSTLRFYPGEQSPMITIRVWHNPRVGKYFGEQSHYIHAPENASEYRSSRNFGTTIEEAAQYTVQSIMLDYQLATSRGITPDETWFVVNDRWR